MKEMIFKIIWVDENGNDISDFVNSIPGLSELFMKAYNESCNLFNARIDSVNKLFEDMYPDHEIDLDDPNDIYIDFIRKRMQPIADLITYKVFRGNPNYRFGYFAEYATFALHMREIDKTISFVMREVK